MRERENKENIQLSLATRLPSPISEPGLTNVVDCQGAGKWFLTQIVLPARICYTY